LEASFKICDHLRAQQSGSINGGPPFYQHASMLLNAFAITALSQTLL
jgi:hypothetical protein